MQQIKKPTEKMEQVEKLLRKKLGNSEVKRMQNDKEFFRTIIQNIDLGESPVEKISKEIIAYWKIED